VVLAAPFTVKEKMKQQVVKTIYRHFDDWSSSQLTTACCRGCTTCCTQNVTITALEGEIIIDYIRERGLAKWFTKKLEENLPDESPVMTTNQFAKACLEEKETDPGQGSFSKRCPFLASGSCMIYEARPFGCRSFISTSTCIPGFPASVPQYFMSAVTAVNQIIEHLGQKEYWGNMLHVLYLLAASERSFSSLWPVNPEKRVIAQTSCLTATPLPGFLISQDDFPKVVPLLNMIFDSEVRGKKIEDILNNK
jgi:Fe-S-cluster containining protein